MVFVMVFALVSCGDSEKPQNGTEGAAPVPGVNDGTGSNVPGGNTETGANVPGGNDETGANVPGGNDETAGQGEEGGEVDLEKLFSGIGERSSTLYSELDPATKSALIAEAKKNGVDLSFGADGSMTIVSDEYTYVQHPDGTWTIKDEDGNESIYGNVWPDNEWTRLLPKPTMAVTATWADEDGFSAAFTDVTVDMVKNYAKQLEAAGFNVDPEVIDMSGMYMFSARNKDGYSVDLSFAEGSSGLSISLESEEE